MHLKGASDALTEKKVLHAVAGGLAANQYRAAARVTADVDFAIVTDSQSEQIAREIIEAFGFKATSLRKAELDGGPHFAVRKKSTPFQVVVGRSPDSPETIGLDMLLPEIAWVPEAVKRAQSNKMSFAPHLELPVLTVEDVIIAKLFAYSARRTRVKDLDDLKSIVIPGRDLDNGYLAAQVKEYGLRIPDILKPNFHYSVLREARRRGRSK